MKKRNILLHMITNPIFVIVYGIAWYFLWSLCQYGEVKKKAPILILCAVFFLIWLIIFLVKIKRSKNNININESKRNIYKTIWIWIAIIIMSGFTIFFGYKTYYSGTKFRGKLSWTLHSLFTERTVEFVHNNIYDDGIDGILSDISEKVNLPKELYIVSNFSVNFKEDGTITSVSTFLYGKNESGKDKTYLVDYDINKSDKINVYLDGYAGTDYNKSKELAPLINTLKAIQLKDVVYNWHEDNYGILYYGDRDFGYNTEGVVYIDSDGKTRLATEAKSLIKGYFVSVYVPGKENTITPFRYKLVNDLKRIEAEDYMGVNEEKKETEDLDLNNSENNSKVLSDGTVEFYLDESMGYNLKVTGAAAGSRDYALYKTTDGGHNWELLSGSPFSGKLGGANGIRFINEDLGFLGLSSGGGAVGSLYRTENGGKSFEKILIPEVNVTLSNGHTYNPFDFPEMPYKKNDDLYMKVNQGSDGDYNGGCKALYQSKDQGKTWEFVEEINER